MSKVSIIVRTKDRLLFLKRAIESISGQTFKDWEAIIVNDGGIKTDIEDFIMPYKKTFNDKIKLIHTKEKTKLRPVAANIGIKSSKCKYIVIHDDDDSWEPEFLEKCVKLLEETDYKGVVTYSNAVYEKVEKDKIKKIFTEPFNKDMNCASLYKMASNNTFPPISFVYKREVHDEIGYYDEELEVLEDWEFNLRFLQKKDIFVIPEFLANYHLRPDIKEQNLANTIFGSGIAVHKKYDSIIRNRLLRQDIANNCQGIGFLVNFSRYFNAEALKNELKEDKKSEFDIKNVNRESVLKNLNSLRHNYKDKEIYCYGAGAYFQNLLKEYNFLDINIKGIFDKDESLTGTEISGYPVLNPDKMLKLNIDLLVITVINPCVVEEYIRNKYHGEIMYLNL
ncbi:MAG: glycosyltransferase [Candidatus Gastranaerophilales bacterium]|nr:glycosyltransferase [Candidatus Gastranaerophilales bacterium]